MGSAIRKPKSSLSLIGLNKFILIPLLTEWLNSDDLIHLDSSITNGARNSWLEMMVLYPKPFVNCLFPNWEEPIILTWILLNFLQKREMNSEIYERQIVLSNDFLVSSELSKLQTSIVVHFRFVSLHYCTSQAANCFLKLCGSFCLFGISLNHWENEDQLLELLSHLAVNCTTLKVVTVRLNINIPSETLCQLFRKNPQIEEFRINICRQLGFHSHLEELYGLDETYDKSVYFAAVVHCRKMHTFEMFEEPSKNRILLVHNPGLRAAPQKIESVVQYNRRPIGLKIEQKTLRIKFMRPPGDSDLPFFTNEELQQLLTVNTVEKLEVEGLGVPFIFALNAVNGARLTELTLADPRTSIFPSVALYCSNLTTLRFLQQMVEDKQLYAAIVACPLLTDLFIGNTMTSYGLKAISRCKRLKKLYVVEFSEPIFARDLVTNSPHFTELMVQLLPIEVLKVFLQFGRLKTLRMMHEMDAEFLEQALTQSMKSSHPLHILLMNLQPNRIKYLRELFPTLYISNEWY